MEFEFKFEFTSNELHVIWMYSLKCILSNMEFDHNPILQKLFPTSYYSNSRNIAYFTGKLAETAVSAYSEQSRRILCDIHARNTEKCTGSSRYHTTDSSRNGMMDLNILSVRRARCNSTGKRRIGRGGRPDSARHCAAAQVFWEYRCFGVVLYVLGLYNRAYS